MNQGFRFPLLTLLGAAVLLCSCGKGGSFEENYQKALANAAGGAGARYDNALGEALRGPGSSLALRECLISNPGQQGVHGYFEIRSSTDYSLVLRPEGGLATCVASHLEHHTIPAPPQSPYLNPYALRIIS